VDKIFLSADVSYGLIELQIQWCSKRNCNRGRLSGRAQRS